MVFTKMFPGFMRIKIKLQFYVAVKYCIYKSAQIAKMSVISNVPSLRR